MSTPPPPQPRPSLHAELSRRARETPQIPAVILPRRGTLRSLGVGPEGPADFRAMSYAELDRRSTAVAAGLSALGIGAGIRTALLVPPDAAFFLLAFGLLKAGAVPVLIDPGIGRRHLATCLDAVAPEAFVGVPRAHLARKALGWASTATRLVTVGTPLPGTGPSLTDVLALGARHVARFREGLPPAPVSSAPAAIAFTSGSTGVPKGVEYQQEQFLAQVEMIRGLYDLQPGETSLATFPPFALLGPALGLTTVIPRMNPTRPARVDPQRIADAVNGFGATVMFGSPALLDTVGRGGERLGLRMPTLRRVISAGAPVPLAVQQRFLRMLGPDALVHTPYGATEALPVTSIGSREIAALAEPGICVGRPVPGVDVAVVPIREEPLPQLASTDLLPAGQIGEVVVRGPNVTRAYAERPEATARAKVSWDGVLAHRMGDAGYLDTDGRLWFCGRTAHRVRVRGGTLYPVPCEVVFDGHRAVRRSALVGVGPDGYQRPVICIELEPDFRARRHRGDLARELLQVAAVHPTTAAIETLLFHPGFPVDIRHNSKIDRTALAAWAERRLG